MKRIITSLLLVALLGCIGVNKAKAQYVTIPDANFASWLRTNYATCMSGNQLDTNCTAILTATTVALPPWLGTSIQNIYGIQYFKNLDTLLCYTVGDGGIVIDSVPALPPRLKYMDCSANAIRSLPTLPSTLWYLSCAQNKLSSLPALPANLHYLDCSVNPDLTSITAWPDSLYYLGLDSDVSLKCLPELTRIVNFSFNEMNLTCLPNYGNVTNSSPALNSLPLCQTGNLSGCPAAALTANAGIDTTDCAGLSVTIGGSPTAGGGSPPYSYLWSPVTGLNSASIANPTVAGITSNLTYTVTITDANSNTATSSVQVNFGGTSPTSTFTAISPVCIGVNSMFTYTGTATSGAIYVWNFDGGTTVSGNNAGPYQVDWTTAGSKNITLLVTQGSCTSTVDTEIVTVLSNCQLPVANAGVNQTVCSGTPVTIGGTPTATAGTAPYSYLWSGGAAATSNPTVTPTVTTTYIVTVTDHNGNTATSSVTVNVLTSSPTSTFTATSPVCAGASCAITYTGNAPSTDIYQWNFDGGSIVSGSGQGPYQVSWPTASPKVITLTVNSGACASLVTTETITVNPSPAITITPNTYTVCAGGIVTLMASGASTYSWTPSASLSSNNTAVVIASPNATITYTVTGTTSGCSSTATVTVDVDSIHIDSIIQLGSSLPAQLEVFASGGYPGYTYIWSNGTTAVNTTSVTDINSVTVTDSRGCFATGADTLNSAYTLVFDSTLVNTPWYYCVNSNGSTDTGRLIVVQQPAFGSTSKRTIGNEVCIVYTPANNYLGSDTFWLQTCSNFSPFACDTTVIVMKVYSACYQCVWPGDANDDGVVNNTDLLPIGVAYGTSGPIRNNATLNWIGQPATYWTDSLTDSTNYKYIDCNGDGIINGDDTVAIVLNYSFTHSRSGGFNAGRSGDPVVYPQVMQDTVYNGDTLTVQLLLGSQAIPATNVYGLAFTLNYDNTVVDTSKTTVTFGNSWLGSTGNKISIAKDLKSSGELQCAVTRIDHTTKSGQGSIGMATFVITTDNLNGKNYSYYNSLFYINKIKMIDNLGNVLAVSAGLDSTEIGFLPTGIHQLNGITSLIHIYPNPANNQLMISSGSIAMEEIKITDVIGNVVLSRNYSAMAIVTQQVLDVSALNSGIYMVEVQTNKGIGVQKLIIAK